MTKDPLSFIGDIVSGDTVKKAGNLISKILSFLTGALSLMFIGAAGIFVIIGMTTVPFFYILAASFIIPAIFLGVLSFKIKNSFFPDHSTQHFNDVKVCEDLLNKIKDYLKNARIKAEFNHIYKTLKEELKEAKGIAVKIDTIHKIMKNPDWDVNNLDKKISIEQDKKPVDDLLIKRLSEQKENIKKLGDREVKLREYLSNLRLNFNSIYTKVTLLDTQDKKSFDQIETEIQKILDFKLKVSQYEEQLQKDIG